MALSFLFPLPLSISTIEVDEPHRCPCSSRYRLSHLKRSCRNSQSLHSISIHFSLSPFPSRPWLGLYLLNRLRCNSPYSTVSKSMWLMPCSFISLAMLCICVRCRLMNSAFSIMLFPFMEDAPRMAHPRLLFVTA